MAPAHVRKSTTASMQTVKRWAALAATWDLRGTAVTQLRDWNDQAIRYAPWSPKVKNAVYNSQAKNVWSFAYRNSIRFNRVSSPWSLSLAFTFSLSLNFSPISLVRTYAEYSL